MRQVLTNAIAASDFAADVAHGLSHAGQKELPSKYLYDTVGSKLFEVIVELPEYGLTRADERILQANADEIVRRVTGDVILSELGSGSGRKTRWILDALARRRHTAYYPIEISRAALELCRRELADIEHAEIIGLELQYLDGLAEVASRRRVGQRILVLFLGSTIGNFRPPADRNFLGDLRHILRPGDCLLLGTDLVKPAAQLLAAYNDPLGVTAAFNLNLLARINRELGADFDLGRFEHVARINSDTGSVEMHLRSKRAQTVTLPGGAIRFEEGETVRTENSHKYTRDEVLGLAAATGFRCDAQWVDRQWPFAESLLIAE